MAHPGCRLSHSPCLGGHHPVACAAMFLVRCLAADLEEGPFGPVARAARAAGFEVAASDTVPALWADLKGEGPRPAVVAVEAAAAALDDFALLRALKAWDPLVEVLLVAPARDPGLAVQAIRLGALDVITPPLEVRARAPLEQVRAERQRRRQASELEARLGETFRFRGMVGKNPLMLDLFSLVARVAPYFSTVLVTGETGSGKTLVARALHDLSPRSTAPFVVCDCAALPDPLLERELFGPPGGAPAGDERSDAGHGGAVARGSAAASGGAACGLLEAADGGTLFLDEIGEMSLPVQAKLLRVLERHEVPGPSRARPVRIDVRVVAATTRSVQELVEAGRFRQDLFERLAAIEIRVPPLRERKDDLPLLTRALLPPIASALGKEVRGLSREAQARLHAYHWPGNVRELMRVLERGALLTSEPFIRVSDLPPYVRDARAPVRRQGGEATRAEATAAEAMRAETMGTEAVGAGAGSVEVARSVAPGPQTPGRGRAGRPAPGAISPGLPVSGTSRRLDELPTLADLERRHIETVLSLTGGNHARAAALLGVSRQALYRKLARHGLARPGGPAPAAPVARADRQASAAPAPAAAGPAAGPATGPAAGPAAGAPSARG